MSTTRDYSGKDKAELANLRANAERILAAPKRTKQHAAARAMLEALPPPPAPTRGGATAAATATTAAVDKLTALASELALVFDLSPPPATIQPHKFAGADGKPKVGGDQRAKTVAAGRYLSHKRGETIVEMGWTRRFEDDAETGGSWYVGEGRSKGETPRPFGEDFDAARLAFVTRLDEIGTPRKG